MKNIESRVAKLEQQAPKDNFLVVIAKKGETQQEAFERVMRDMNISRPINEFFVIFLNLHGNRLTTAALPSTQTVDQKQDIASLDKTTLDEEIFLKH